MEPKKIICPNCDYEQTDIDECVKCGVIISKYVAIQKKRGAAEEKEMNRDLRIENTSGQGKRSTVPSEIKGWNWGAFF